MRKLARKLLAIMTLAICSANISTVEAATPAYDMDGNGYRATRGAPSLGVGVALGTIAGVAILAVLLQNSSGHSAHSSHL